MTNYKWSDIKIQISNIHMGIWAGLACPFLCSSFDFCPKLKPYPGVWSKEFTTIESGRNPCHFPNYLAFSYSCLVNFSIMVVENAQKVSPWSSIDLFHVGPPGLCEWLIKIWLKEPNDGRLASQIYDPNLCAYNCRDKTAALNIMISTKREKILHWVWIAKTWAANLWRELLGKRHCL